MRRLSLFTETRLCIAIITAALAASCGDTEPGIATSNGPAFDRSFDTPPARFELVKELKIGDSMIPEEIVTRVTGLKINRDGLIFIMQPDDKTIRVFDSTGVFVRTMGREGQGPGEFTGFGFFGFTHDSLWVTDPTQNRVSLFGPSGKIIRYLETSVAPPDARYYPAPPLAYMDNGTVLVKFTADQEGTGEEITRPPDLVMRATSDGEIIDTISVLEMPVNRIIEPDRTGTIMRDGIPMQVNYGPTYARRPINSAPYLVVAADGSHLLVIFRDPPAHPDSAAFTLVRIGSDGKIISDVAYGYTPRPVTQAINDSLMPMPPDSAPASMKERSKFLRDNADMPKYLPPVNRMIIGRDKTIWVASDWAETRERWTIIGEDNEVVGSVDMPKGFRVMQVDRTRAWGVETDSLTDVPYVVRYKLQMAGERR